MKLMYITNEPKIAKIADSEGVDWIFIDLEILNKDERQGHLDTVISKHSINDIPKVKKVLKNSELLVRINPINEQTQEEVEAVISFGADIIMLPFFSGAADVDEFLNYVHGRVKTCLLLETPQAVEDLDNILNLSGIDYIHIGLNDLHLGYELNFMFELLANGKVEEIINKIKKTNIKYGFGGIARIGEGTLSAEAILKEHIRMNSQMVILSRSFYTKNENDSAEKIRSIFNKGVSDIRKAFADAQKLSNKELIQNKNEVAAKVEQIVVEVKKRPVKLTEKKLLKLNDEFGNSYYILDSNVFKKNYMDLLNTFNKIYNKTNIAYSYKTNYIPRLCKIVDELGGYAEVVSDMEYQLARKIGAKNKNIYFNGPYKRYWAVERLLLDGGIVNIDSLEEFSKIEKIARENPLNSINIGIRLNYDVGDGVTSRFGFDTLGDDFKILLEKMKTQKNILVNGLHVHFAARSVKYWGKRASGVIDIYDKYFKNGKIKFISLGGGLYGNMPESLKKQFNSEIPTFEEYAEVAATVFADYFKDYSFEDKPELLLEPGSALAGDAMRFVAKVESIKNVRSNYIATLSGSKYNINPTMNSINPPIEVFVNSKENIVTATFNFAGFTCIEGDYMFKGYTGPVSCGSYVVFSNVGSYSIVLKPPFILPNFPVIDISGEKAELVKEEETFEDVFKTYIF